MQPAGTGEGGWLPLLRPLRLVEVQLTAAYEEQKWAANKPSEAAPTGSLAEYRTRRCAVCGDRHPSFGFGPPFSQDGTTIWACGSHRNEVDRQMTATGQFTCAPAVEKEREGSDRQSKQPPPATRTPVDTNADRLSQPSLF